MPKVGLEPTLTCVNWILSPPKGDQKRWLLGLEFATFAQAFVRMPCQLIRTGRRLLFRLLSWNPYQRLFFRMAHVLRC